MFRFCAFRVQEMYIRNYNLMKEYVLTIRDIMQNTEKEIGIYFKIDAQCIIKTENFTILFKG